jgi:pyrroline-5-carboxylate reductase
MRLGFIGTGEITASVVTGLSASGGAHSIWLSPRNAAMAQELANRFDGISVATSNQEVLENSDVIVIAVRPGVVRDVVSGLRFRPEHQVISVVAGLSLRSLAELVAPAVRIARAVPLPSAAKRLSPTAIYPPDPTAVEIFAAVGTVFPVKREKDFDAMSASSATIASYLAFTETIASWLEQQDVSGTQARDYIAQLFYGVTSGAVEAPERGFQAVAATYATAGGLNEQLLRHLSEHGFLTRVTEGLDAVLRRIAVEP